MAFKLKSIPAWAYFVVAVALVVAFGGWGMRAVAPTCKGSYVYCPGVGCVSGVDKCFPYNQGGASSVFSKETFIGAFFDGIPASVPETQHTALKYTATTRPPLTPINEYSLMKKPYEHKEQPQPKQSWFKARETFVSKKCPDGTRTDGPCLMEF
jgi:hypothetical protein